MQRRLTDALITAVIAFLLALPLAGVRTAEGMNGVTVEWHIDAVALAAGLVFLGRLALGLLLDRRRRVTAAQTEPAVERQASPNLPAGVIPALAEVHLPGTSRRRQKWIPTGAGMTLLGHRSRQLFGTLNRLSLFLLLLALIFPLTPLASRYALDVAVMVLTYIMLAWGLNITVGYAGLLDLGFAGFYALGAYSYALLAQATGIGFWTALPLAGTIAAGAAFLLGLPVLRLRGDYFAIVTLGFGEIVRLVLTGWTGLTNGPNGISGIPRPTLFGLEFARTASAGQRTFAGFFGLDFNATHRVIFLYYIILALALAVGWFSARLRKLPLGRGWEAYREDEIARAALGINRWGLKLAAYSLGALVAGMAGAFFATRQGFISPESFTFTESATMLAIVILGGIGHPLGIVAAALFIIGLPELFRGLEQYRMLAFGAGMVLIMIWRPGGMISVREPTVRLPAEPPAV